MFPKLEKLEDLFVFLSTGLPKRIVFDLSEDGTYYNTKIDIDIVDKSKDKKYKGYIECRTKPKVLECPLVYDFSDRETKIFTITIPDLDE